VKGFAFRAVSRPATTKHAGRKLAERSQRGADSGSLEAVKRRKMLIRVP